MAKPRRKEQSIGDFAKKLDDVYQLFKSLDGQTNDELDKIPLNVKDSLIKKDNNQKEVEEAQKRLEDPVYDATMQTVNRLVKQIRHNFKK